MSVDGPRVTAAEVTATWWREAVTYEVYVRSFSDADGDGLGDLPGVRQRLPYLRDLGVDAVWLTPFYPSPDHDAGYDVSDHRAVDARLGGLDDFDALVTEAHSLGLRIVVDLVLNHVSTAHPWFQAALQAGPGSPERERFHVLRGAGPDGSAPPNNWSSIFSGSAWSPFGDGEWYLHLFDTEQPDVRHDHPDVAADADRTLRFWLDRGVDGVRFDAAGAMAKNPGYPALPDGWEPGDASPFSDLDAVHELFRRWSGILREYDGDRLGVAEVWAAPTVLTAYLRPDEMGQAFAIDPVFLPLAAAQWQAKIDDHLAATTVAGRLPGWVHGNHDVGRAATRWGSDGSRALLLMLLALPGAFYLYGGDELGLPEVRLPDEALRDPTFRRSGGADRGRDGCRVPLPWTDGPAPHGFGPAGTVPWLPQPAGWGDLSVAGQLAAKDSMLSLTQEALRLRREHWLGRGADVSWLDAPTGCLAFRRGEDGLTCLANLSGTARPWTAYGQQVVLCSAPGRLGHDLPARSTMWVR